MKRVVFAPGATLFEEGDAGEALYIVTAGHAEMTRCGGHLAQLGPGSRFGEIEPLPGDLPRTASVRAAGDTALHVGVLARDHIAATLASSAKLAETVVRGRLPAPAAEAS